MRQLGFSPSVRIFEAAACGTPILTDLWDGIDTFFSPGREILVVETTEDVVAVLRDLPESERAAIGTRSRERFLRDHTPRQRALDFIAALSGV